MNTYTSNQLTVDFDILTIIIYITNIITMMSIICELSSANIISINFFKAKRTSSH